MKECIGPAGVASPDPCVASRIALFDGDVELTVLTSSASLWTCGVSGDCCLLNPQTVDLTFGDSGLCGTLRNFRCSNDNNAACSVAADCSFGSCIDPPEICDGNFSVMCSGNGSPCTGTCGEVVALNLALNLDCGGTYSGGGGNAIPLPFPVPDLGTSIAQVMSCGGAAPEMNLGATTALDTGTDRTCTSAGCFTQGVTGTASCDGNIDLNMTLSTVLHLGSDILPGVSGVQPCPLCTGGMCQGGPNDGSLCTLGSSNLGDAFPTSHDCPPDPGQALGALPFAMTLTTGTSTVDAHDLNATSGGPASSAAFAGTAGASFSKAAALRRRCLAHRMPTVRMATRTRVAPSAPAARSARAPPRGSACWVPRYRRGAATMPRWLVRSAFPRHSMRRRTLREISPVQARSH